ncbi:single-stranded DNA-binding protein [Streptosporangium sp. NBC_01469]|uniref:single-stranded DNA-binding protein n=1 Tax=Streptosporangium sp. NBC_01469 TaxID=2903898 RepID=UPI002E2A7E61|nr:single-stranded DNA-binding protein [Streptosporangium sp. NBC_01469]
MNDIYVTLTGNVAAPPRQHTFPDGSRVTSLKIASTSRYFDRENQQWRNGETTYFGVRCFRGLADNVAQSVQSGQPVVVQGRLRIREFTHEGERRFMPEVEANSLGHDLRWGLGRFSKPQRSGPVAAFGSAERIELDRETSDWAMSGGAPVAAGALGTLPPLKTGFDDEMSVPREAGITSGGEAAQDGAISADTIDRPATTVPEDTTDPGDTIHPGGTIHPWDAAEVASRPADREPSGADHESAGGNHGSAGAGAAKGEAVAGRARAARSTTTRRRDARGTRSSGAGEETAGSGPGAMKIHPEASDETPWPTREPVAA